MITEPSGRGAELLWPGLAPLDPIDPSRRKQRDIATDYSPAIATSAFVLYNY
ncbi:hypothetical protein [Endozoicomonas sp. YOMI1]|uniref:hypothetical protein n=1 Tax=Endozoicomonas sp. YOMI1 TaxID=2828739 RepID=UPI002148D3ED|nr:hypothetical protein [Endozoicomonas sp. YOMI1]